MVSKLIAMYDKASIPTVTPYRIFLPTNAFHGSYHELMKSYKRYKEEEFFKKEVEDLKNRLCYSLTWLHVNTK